MPSKWKRIKETHNEEDDDDEIQPPHRRHRTNVIESDSEDEDDLQQYYDLQQVRQRPSRRFRTKASVYNINVKKFPEHEQPLVFVSRLFNRMVDDIKDKSQAQGNDRMRLSIYHPGLKMGVHVPFSDVATLKGGSLLQEIEKVIQSNDEFRIDDGQMSMEVTHTRIPSGSGRKGLHHGLYFDSQNMRKMKTSIVQIENARDSMCLARAIVVGKCHADRDDSDTWKKTWKHIRKSDRPFQISEASRLLDRARVPKTKSCSIDEYKKIQAVLAPEYIIKVYSQHAKDELMFECLPVTRQSKVIHVYYNQNHYDTITNIKGFLGCGYYCEFCDVGYSHRGDHCCPHGCVGCFEPEPCEPDIKQYCGQCRRTFKSQICFQNHKRVRDGQKKSICSLVKNCEKCHQRIVERKKSDHACPGMKKCKSCKTIVEAEHKCFIQPYTPKEETEENETRFIFFDFEAKQDTGEHVPNFCVAHRACDVCIDLPIEAHCPNCSQFEGGRERTFQGDSTLNDFCTWLFDPVNRGVTAIAHNFGGYDGQFILRHVIEHGTDKPELAMTGNNIITMNARGVRFIDSLHFLNMKLAKFPATFGLTELKKGYFPHMANTDQFWNYTGPYLDAKYYSPDSMSEKDRETFMAWHDEKIASQVVFCFRQEIEEYCRSDVDILRRSCGRFRDIFKSYSGLDPLMNAITIAQACSQVWRKDYMPVNSVGLIPPQGYPNEKKYSIKAVRWIQNVALTESKFIHHALNGGEKQIQGMYVDGFDPQTNTVYEFQGCLWHGCPTCYTDRDFVNPFNRQRMHSLYEMTETKIRTLKNAGFTVVELWEHDFDKLCKENVEFKTAIDSLWPHRDPLKPRDALFGGRTNAIKLSHEIEGDEEIKYIDICSLYPYVCKYGLFSVGHPEIYTQENIDMANIRQYTGVLKCKVLPPTQLYHPVLPYKCNNKLLFPLCRTCADTLNKDACHHSDEQRALVGTWVSTELIAALDRGYRLVEVYEIWHFPETCQYDREKGEDGFFAGYINNFLKIKQEASGYPSWCQTEEDCEKFKQDYYEAEGIRLENVERNEGKRSFSKIVLNSLWGKLAQRDNLTKTEYISNPSQYFELITDPNKLVKHVEPYGEEFILVNWEELDSLVEPHQCSNVIVAAFVTAQARLKLYSVLEPLGERVLYFDTDSCIYVHKPDQWNPTIVNNRLGEWTDEKPDAKITKFVGMGPKNYGYEYVEHVSGKRKSTCKVKGLTLDYNTSRIVNFDTMKQWLDKERDTFSIIVEYKHRIKKNKNRTVSSETQHKTYRFVYNKRVIQMNGTTVPYGYQ